MIGETGFMEGTEQELSRAVAGENPAGAIGAMRARSQTDNDDASFRIAKTSDGLTPVSFLLIGAAADPPNLLAMRHQSRT